MTIANISDKGQVTLPADMRKRLGIRGRSKVQIDINDQQITIRPIKSVREVRGIFHDAALRKPADWESVRAKAENSVAQQVASEGVE